MDQRIVSLRVVPLAILGVVIHDFPQEHTTVDRR